MIIKYRPMNPAAPIPYDNGKLGSSPHYVIPHGAQAWRTFRDDYTGILHVSPEEAVNIANRLASEGHYAQVWDGPRLYHEAPLFSTETGKEDAEELPPVSNALRYRRLCLLIAAQELLAGIVTSTALHDPQDDIYRFLNLLRDQGIVPTPTVEDGYPRTMQEQHDLIRAGLPCTNSELSLAFLYRAMIAPDEATAAEEMGRAEIFMGLAQAEFEARDMQFDREDGRTTEETNFHVDYRESPRAARVTLAQLRALRDDVTRQEFEELYNKKPTPPLGGKVVMAVSADGEVHITPYGEQWLSQFKAKQPGPEEIPFMIREGEGVTFTRETEGAHGSIDPAGRVHFTEEGRQLLDHAALPAPEDYPSSLTLTPAEKAEIDAPKETPAEGRERDAPNHERHAEPFSRTDDPAAPSRPASGDVPAGEHHDARDTGERLHG